jgi:hypothetical protein
LAEGRSIPNSGGMLGTRWLHNPSVRELLLSTVETPAVCWSIFLALIQECCGGSPSPGIRALKLRMGVTSEPCLVAEGGWKYYRKLRAIKSRIDQRRRAATQ